VSTKQQDNERRNVSIKILKGMLEERKEIYKNNPPANLGQRLEYDLKIMALEEAIEALLKEV
jgi:hypothetical protein